MPQRFYALLCLTLALAACGGGGSGDGESDPPTDGVRSGIPQVTVTAPLANARFSAPGVIDVMADATDADGTITAVEFFANGASIGQKTLPPYTVRWSSPPRGTHDLTAVARDDDGNQTTSPRVRIVVDEAENMRPSAALVSPANHAHFTAAGDVLIKVEASDPDGSIVQVDFLVSSYPIGNDATPPYTLTWHAPPGEHLISAVVADDAGAIASTSQITITVADDTGAVPDNSPPTISLAQPADGAQYTFPAAIALEALAADLDGAVVRVDFYADAVLIGADDIAPFTLTWSDAAVGSHQLTAVAIDDGADVATSAGVDIAVVSAVVPPNTPPTVSFRQPADGAVLALPADLAIEAVAADSDGTVARVDFYADAALIGSDTSSPYTVTWSGAAAGAHHLSVVAVDDDTDTAAASIAVTLEQPAPGEFVIDTVRLGDPEVCYDNPEFTDDGRYAVWGERIQALNDNNEGILRMWHCAIDPETGDFVPADCKGYTGFDSTNYGRAYVGRDSQGTFYLGADANYRLVMTRITGPDSGVTIEIGSLADTERRAIYPTVLPSSDKIYVYWLKSHGRNLSPQAADWVELRYLDTDDPTNEIVVERQDNNGGLAPMDITFPRWAFRQPLLIYGHEDAPGRINIFQLDVSQPALAPVQLTDDWHRKSGPFPVVFQGRRYILAGMDGTTESYLYGESDGGGPYEILEAFAPAPEDTFDGACLANSHEPVILDDKLYTTYQITDCDDSQEAFPFFTETGEIWFTQLLDGADELWRISQSSTDVKNEPEPVAGSSRAWVYYTVYPEGYDQITACFEVYRAATPAGLP